MTELSDKTFAETVAATLLGPARSAPISAIILDFDQAGHLYAFAPGMAPVKVEEGEHGMSQLYFLIMDRRMRSHGLKGFSTAPTEKASRAPYTEQELKHQAHHHTQVGDGKATVDTCPFCRALGDKIAREKKVELTADEDFAE